MAVPISDVEPSGIKGWNRRIFDDEVIFWPVINYSNLSVSQYPLVPGFFVTDVPYFHGTDCTRILAGPFPTLETAIASIALTS